MRYQLSTKIENDINIILVHVNKYIIHASIIGNPVILSDDMTMTMTMKYIYLNPTLYIQ